MAKKKEKPEQAEKKSRAKYKRPDDVGKLIDLVNLVPFPKNMMNLGLEIEYRTRILREQTGDSNAGVSLRDVLIEALQDLPEEFHNYLKGFCYASWLRPIDISKADFRDVHHLSQAYMSFYQTHNETVAYAFRLKNDREGKSYPNSWEIFPSRASGVILKDDKGNMYLDGLAGVIHKIIPDRFRMCEICNRIFWAKRDDSLTHSEQCANTLRVRLSRSLTDEQKAERKAKRESNKIYKNKPKTIRKIK
jgi:hypothetical protein